MRKCCFLLILSLLFLSCSCGHKVVLDNVSKEKFKQFQDFKLIDGFKLDLGNIEEDWNVVIDECLKTLDKEVLLINEGYTSEVKPDYSEIITTDSGKSIFIKDSLHTVIYSMSPETVDVDGFDKFRYFDIFCKDFKKIDYKGDINGQVILKQTNNEVIRIIDVKRSFFGRIFSNMEEIEFVFFEKKQKNLVLYNYLFECPVNIDKNHLLKSWNNSETNTK